MKRLAIILLGIFALTLFPVLPAEASGDGNRGTVVRGQYGNFKSIKWQIKATGATTGIRYRTIERTVTINGHAAAFSPDLPNPAPGKTISQPFIATAADLASGMGVSPQDVEDWMNSGAVATMSAKVQIYNHDTGEVLGTYADYSTLYTAMTDLSFDSASLKDIETLWGIADDPDRPSKTPETPISA